MVLDGRQCGRVGRCRIALLGHCYPIETEYGTKRFNNPINAVSLRSNEGDAMWISRDQGVLLRRATCLIIIACSIYGCGRDCPVAPQTPRTLSVWPDGRGLYSSICEAVTSARDGDVIELADGTYRGVGNRDIDFLGKAIVLTSSGGYAEACTLDCGGTEEDPHRAFWFHSGEGPSSVLKDLTIVDGYVDTYGGGILCENGSSPTISGIVLARCTGWLKGGGLYVNSGSKPLVESCSFISNHAGGGGGACCFHSSPRIRICRFEGNHAGLGGGLEVFLSGFEEAVVERCVFIGNRGGSGGAMFFQEVETMVVDCASSGNFGDFGGAVFCADASPILIRCTSFQDTAEHHGASMHCQDHCEPQVASCTFTHGYVEMSGSLIHLVGESNPAFTRCILSFCTNGKALDCSGTDPTPVIGCSNIFGNDGGDWTGCIESQYGIQGNICADPLFCDPGNGDLFLRPDSPCRGDSSACGTMGALPVMCR